MQHDGTLSTHDKLIYMANQIAKFFAVEGDEAAAGDTAHHLEQFWDPRMRSLIIAHLDAGGAGLDPIARAAVTRLAAQARAGVV